MNQHTNIPATRRALREIVEEYEQKRAALPGALADIRQRLTDLEMAATIGGTYAGRVHDMRPPAETQLERNLLQSAWMHVYGLGIERLATAKERKQFEQAFQNPAPFTLGNIRATFERYLLDPRTSILRGLAEAFCDLDMSYKSHSKVKIGVKGLPKRIIIGGVCSEFTYDSYGQNKLADAINAVETYRGNPVEGKWKWIQRFTGRDALRAGSVDSPIGEIRLFGNGNAHVMFDPQSLLDINRALAEFYGDVLPDVEPDDDERDLFRQPGTAVSKDLQYYPTPARVADEAIGYDLDERWEGTVLEPSCGCGRLMEAVRRRAPKARIAGIEYNGARAQEARDKGFGVTVANFLDCPPTPVYDLVVMNPPFYGLHWQKHLLHAMKFLRPAPDPKKPWEAGRLTCILPATAFYDGHLGKMGLVPKDAHLTDRGWRDTGWKDLPVGSFSESGTNVPTGYLRIGRR